MLEGFSWLRANSDASCVTFAWGVDTTELLRRFGGDLSRARLVEQDDGQALQELSRFGAVIRVGQCDGWAVVFEDNGYQGTRPEVLHPASAGTVAVSVFYNVNAHTRFCHADNGRVLANFEPHDLRSRWFLAPASPQVLTRLARAGITPRAEDEDEEDGNLDSVESMFALAEAVGVRFDKASIAEEPLLCSYIRNPFSDFVGEVLSRGGDEHTASRLLDLLGDGYQRRRFFSFFHRWLQRDRFPHFPFRNEREPAEDLHPVDVRILSALQSVQIALPLLQALQAENEELRSAAAEVLKILIQFDRLRDQEGARERLELLASAPDPEVALHAAIALGTRDDERAVEPLLRLLPLYPGKRDIIHLLGHLRAGRAAAPLFSLLDPHGEDIDLQRLLINALEQIEGPHVVERLLPLLHGEAQTPRERSFQQALLASMARQGDARLAELLLQRLNPHPTSFSSYVFQLQLLKALGTLGERHVIERLAHLLVSDPSTCGSYERQFQESLVKTLRHLGDTRAEVQEVEAALQRLKASTKHKISGWVSPNNISWGQRWARRQPAQDTDDEGR